MKKMYVAFSRQNGRDTTVPGDAIIMVSEDPLKVKNAALTVFDKEAPGAEGYWVSDVLIFSVDPDKPYRVHDAKRMDHDGNLAFYACRSAGNPEKINQWSYDPTFGEVEKEEPETALA